MMTPKIAHSAAARNDPVKDDVPPKIAHGAAARNDPVKDEIPPKIPHTVRAAAWLAQEATVCESSLYRFYVVG